MFYSIISFIIMLVTMGEELLKHHVCFFPLVTAQFKAVQGEGVKLL